MSRRICKRRKDQVWTNPTVVLYTLSRFAYPISLRRSRLDRRAPAGQYSRYERDGETTIFILRVPIHDAEAEVTYSTTSLRSNELLIEKTSKSRFAKLGETEEDLPEDVVTEQKQAIEMADIYSNILSGMMDAFAGIIGAPLVLSLLGMIFVVRNKTFR